MSKLTMCDQQVQLANALINAQSRSIILVMVAWFLACLLALCIAVRTIYRFRSSFLRSLPLTDDIVAVTTSLCGLGSIVTISTAVDSGLGKRHCLLTPEDFEQTEIKVFVSTILFILTISLSKCSTLFLLHQMAQTTLQRLSIILIDALVLLWTIAVMAYTVFQCEMPEPWAIWTGRCIPILPFLFAVVAVDIAVDSLLMLLAMYVIQSSSNSSYRKTQASSLFLLRLVVIVASILQIHYAQRAFSSSADPTFDYVPYSISTQIHTALAALLPYTLILKPFLHLHSPSPLPYSAPTPKSRLSKHWSGTTVGGTPYSSYFSFVNAYHSRSRDRSQHQIPKEPLPAIQASMLTYPSIPNTSPSSPHISKSAHPALRTTPSTHIEQDILLPDPPLPARYARAPPRPPPPSERERPDLSVFTRKTVLREPPMVTRLGSVRDVERNVQD